VNALIFGYSYALLAAPASLLVRSGFKIDLLCPHHHHINTSDWVEIAFPKHLLVSNAIDLLSSKKYDLVVIGDDYCMGDIIDSNIPIELKLKLLPVISSNHFEHLFSKCALSKILREAGIPTPEFFICHSQEELIEGAKKIGFPLFMKVDRSGGGCGVFECANNEELLRQCLSFSYPLLLQKKVEGNIVDMTAFYQNGCLIDFSYSVFYKTVGGPFGASSVRGYIQLGCLPKEIFSELERLGIALGAHGFVNITCMESLDLGKRYFIEADMRPNVWVDHGKYIGNDGAQNIYQYFLNGRHLSYPQAVNPLYPKSKLISYADRLAFYELLFNRYGCWGSFNSSKDVYSYILRRVGYKPYFIRNAFRSLGYHADLNLRLLCSRYLKQYLPRSFWEKARKLYRHYFHKM
jgi:hypothetical protein